MSLTKLSLGGNSDIIYNLFPPRESLVGDIQAGDENIEKLLYGVVYKENMASFKSTKIKYSKLKLFAFFSRIQIQH
jgi:hypothetical protein